MPTAACITSEFCFFNQFLRPAIALSLSIAVEPLDFLVMVDLTLRRDLRYLSQEPLG